ncbi:MAG TPA: hypothetical protein DEQ01_01700, partial [Thermoanaerobacter sp.]|nr:hypothetical protein [Thermoanaerobacter sp.]
METKQEVIEAIKKFKQERQLTKAEQFLNTIVPQQKENIQSEEVEDVQEAIPWPEDLPEEAYHGLIGEIVRAIEPYTEAD